MLPPPSPLSFVWFWLICSRKGGSTAAVVTLDTAVDESRKKIADRVARFPTRLCSRDGKLRYYRRLEYDFLAFLPCLLQFFFSVLIPVCFSSWCRFVRAAVICSSSASSTCSFCFICILPRVRTHFVLFVLYFSQLSFSRLACLL